MAELPVRINVAALSSKDGAIYLVLICGAALAVLNPMVVGIFVHRLSAHNIMALLYCLDAILGIIVITSILYLKSGHKGLFITSVGAFFLLPVLMVFAELAVTYYRLVYVGRGASTYSERDAELGWRLKASAHARHVSAGNYNVVYRMDEEGRKFIPQEKGVKNSIHFFGESFIFGQGVTNEETAVNLLAKKLRGHFNVLNYGVPGYGVEQMLLYLRSRLSNVQPDDVVVFAVLSADLRRNFIHRAHFCKYVLEYGPDDSPSLPMWTENGWMSVRVSDECTALEALLLNSSGLLGRLYRWRHEDKVADEILGNADRVFSEGAELARTHGASFYIVFVTNPLECERRAFEVNLNNLKFPFESFLPYCPEDKELLSRLHFPSDYHWTPEGNRWAAGVLEQILRTKFRMGLAEDSVIGDSCRFELAARYSSSTCSSKGLPACVPVTSRRGGKRQNAIVRKKMMEQSLSKIVCIGIDAGDKDLVAQWAREGILPTFRMLLDTAAWAFTENPIGIEASSAWPSFYTGALPGRTGQYNGRVHFCPKTYEDRVPYEKREISVDPIWTRLSRAGKRVAVIDAPYTLLEKGLNGVQLIDWGTHARAGGCGVRTWPPHLKQEVIARFGDDQIGESDSARPRTAREHDAFRNKLIDRIERKTALALHFLQQSDWDCYLIVFGEAHSVGHHCWYLHDATYPRHDKALARKVGDPIKDIYIKIDAAVGEILDTLGSDSTVFVFLSHGMGPHHSGSEFLDDILFRLEKGKGSPVREFIADMLKETWIKLPHGVRNVLMPLRDPANRALIENKKADRQYFEVENNYKTAGVRINLIGREREGKVKAGEEYEGLCNQLTETLLSLINPATGRPLVRQIYRTNKLHNGPHLKHLPDLLVDWNREAPIEAVYSPKFGTMKNRRVSGRSGDHRPQGMIFARSSSILPGQIDRIIPVIDFAPTFGALLGVELQGVDGQPIAEFCGQEIKVSYESQVPPAKPQPASQSLF